MVKLINFASPNMTLSQFANTASAYKHGVNVVYEYGVNQITPEFRKMNEDILSADRGAGYWLWKPYFIYKMLLGSSDGDIVIYSDAGVEWIDSPQHIIDVMGQDIFLFTSGHLHREYCKSDVTHMMNIAYAPDQQQVHAAVIFIRVSEWSRRFVKEWLLWCQMPGLIDDSPSVLPNHPDFKDHRHDQSILSCLAIREGLTLHYWPDELWFSTQRHRWPNDKYPLLFRHHRLRNHEWP